MTMLTKEQGAALLTAMVNAQQAQQAAFAAVIAGLSGGEVAVAAATGAKPTGRATKAPPAAGAAPVGSALNYEKDVKPKFQQLFDTPTPKAGKDLCKAILAEFKVPQGSVLAPDQLPAFLARVEAELAKASGGSDDFPG